MHNAKKDTLFFSNFIIMKQLFLLIVVFIFLYSCSKEDVIENYDKEEPKKTTVEKSHISDVIEGLKINKREKTLSQVDARKIAQMFNLIQNSNKVGLRSAPQEKTIKSVDNVRDLSGNTLMYVVNFDQGFCVISATKKYAPILAFSEEGSFSLDPENKAWFWLDGLGAEIISHREDSVSKFEAEWSRYEKEFNALRYTGKRPDSEKQIYWWRAEMIHELRYDSKYALDPGIVAGKDYYESYMTIAEAESQCSGEVFRNVKDELAMYGLDEDVAIVRAVNFSSTQTVNPLIRTQWYQSGPYSEYLSNTKHLLGCVPVALGQILNYHRHPEGYVDWDKANDDMAAQLMAKIGAEIGMVYGEKQSFPKFWKAIPFDMGDLSQVKKFLSNNEYFIKKESVKGNLSEISLEILNSRPVYVEGTKKWFSILGINIPSTDAHAWVCDGYKGYGSGVYYMVYAPKYFYHKPDAILHNNPFEYYPYDDYNMGHGWTQYFHMNWGWAHKIIDFNEYAPGNGWYKGFDISIEDDTNYEVLVRYISAQPNK